MNRLKARDKGSVEHGMLSNVSFLLHITLAKIIINWLTYVSVLVTFVAEKRSSATVQFQYVVIVKRSIWIVDIRTQPKRYVIEICWC
jgi:hypothetical protein